MNNLIHDSWRWLTWPSLVKTAVLPLQKNIIFMILDPFLLKPHGHFRYPLLIMWCLGHAVTYASALLRLLGSNRNSEI